MPPSFHFFNEDSNYSLKSKLKIKRLLSALLENEKKLAGDLNIVFCSDEHLLGINRQYLAHDYLTDIITFDYTEGNTVSGDLFISIERVKENAKTLKVAIFDEVLRVIIHGTLHLAGYKDKSKKDKEIMTSKENFYLCQFLEQ